MNLIVKDKNTAIWKGKPLRCAIGRHGVCSFENMQEGQGKTPVGVWRMREVFYRPDRLPRPETVLPVRAIEENDAWCDIPNEPKYNQLVKLPHPTKDEKLWRADHVYDIVVVLGYNDERIVPGKGSAIFLHLAPPSFEPSAGCVTLSKEDLLQVLKEADPQSSVEVIDS